MLVVTELKLVREFVVLTEVLLRVEYGPVFSPVGDPGSASCSSDR